MTPPPIVCAVSGPKNSGKTFLIEQLVQELARRDVDFAVAKHDAHAHMAMDHEGKDSWRYREAGAPRVAVIGPLGQVRLDFSAPFAKEACARTALEGLFPGVDLVVAEGFKDHPLPRIKLVTTAAGPATHVVFRAEPALDTELAPDDAVPLTLDVCLQFIEELLARPLARRSIADGNGAHTALPHADIPGR
ncbi:MAG: molybdopterin-guanine dinucleotide biosynthesis protein B [Dehalococcoidia bacterium]|nr:molybdopterin-guanine dinucleotide biosynthesis protein B [Dehalococcoidia bacterium]